MGSHPLRPAAYVAYATAEESVFDFPSLAFATDVAFFEYAGVPFVILCVRRAIPLTTFFTASNRWSVARLIQMRLRLAGWRRSVVAFLFRRLWMHGGTSCRGFYSR